MTNYQINFDPNGGDLGRGNITHIQPLEFMIIVPHIADIFEQLHLSGNSRLPYKYAFEFSDRAINDITLVMNNTKLPPHVKWYETDGLRVFKMRGNSGGVVTSAICYLITSD